MIEVEKVRPSGLFTNYIFKAIPLAFDESMSYYECLCGLLHYLKNTIIPALNNNADAVIEVQNLMTELQNYVDNYFNNTFPEMLDEKLDELVENGTIANMLENYANIERVFNTAEDMKADTTLIAGQKIKTLGYYEINDGGESEYIIRDSEPSTYYENIGNVLYAELIIDDILNVKQIGVDDTNLVTKLNTLLNNENYIKYQIYVPNDDYVITSPIIVNKEKTILTIDANININTDISILKILSSNNIININGNLSSTAVENEGTGIEIGNNTTNVGFNNIFVNSILNTENGILLNPDNNTGCHYNKIKFNRITASYGIRLKVGDTSTPWVNENTFIGGRLSGGIGVYTEKGLNQTDPYNGNKFNEIGYEDIECGIELNYAKWNIFDECRMAEHLTGDFWIYCHDDSYDNVFNIQQNIRVTTIKDDNNSINTRNIYNPSAICDSEWHRIGKSCYSGGGKFIIPEGQCYDNDIINIQHYNKNGAITNPIIFASDNIISVGGDLANANYDVILPAGVYNIRKLKSFYIYVVYKEPTSTINIKDSDNNVLINTTAFGDSKVSKKLYQVKYLPDRYAGYTWKLIPLL